MVREMLARLSEFLRRSGAEHESKVVDWEADARRLGVRPVCADMGGWFGVTATGDVFSALHDTSCAPERVSDARVRNMVLYRASTRYPDLAHLAPRRVPGDPDCEHCGGTGQVPLPEGLKNPEHFACACGGLGWVPS